MRVQEKFTVQAGDRIFGPYPHRGGWRIIRRRVGSSHRTLTFEDEEVADSTAKGHRRRIAELESKEQERTVKDAIDAYELHQRTKGNAEISIALNVKRIRSFFAPEESIHLIKLTPQKCDALYRKYREDAVMVNGTPRLRSPATHQQGLTHAKGFLKWCAEQDWIKSNPAERIKPVGKARAGKPQLHYSETLRWEAYALGLARGGEPGGLAALMTFYFTLRASEVIWLQVRDFDDLGESAYLIVEKHKRGTKKRPPLTVPSFLLELMREQTAGKKPTDAIFPYHRNWVTKWVKRICKATDVPVVCAHSMRGLHSTFGTLAGQSPALLASVMGHTERIMADHYVAPGASGVANHEAAMRRLEAHRGSSGKLAQNVDADPQKLVGASEFPNGSGKLPTSKKSRR